jgi:hypothetical protein
LGTFGTVATNGSIVPAPVGYDYGGIGGMMIDLPFTTAPGPRQGSHFRVRVPWDSLY